MEPGPSSCGLIDGQTAGYARRSIDAKAPPRENCGKRVENRRVRDAAAKKERAGTTAWRPRRNYEAERLPGQDISRDFQSEMAEIVSASPTGRRRIQRRRWRGIGRGHPPRSAADGGNPRQVGAGRRFARLSRIRSPWAALLEVCRGLAYRAHDPVGLSQPDSGDGAAIHGGRFTPGGRPRSMSSLDPSRDQGPPKASRENSSPVCSAPMTSTARISSISAPSPARPRERRAQDWSAAGSPKRAEGRNRHSELARRLQGRRRRGHARPELRAGRTRKHDNLVLWRWRPEGFIRFDSTLGAPAHERLPGPDKARAALLYPRPRRRLAFGIPTCLLARYRRLRAEGAADRRRARRGRLPRRAADARRGEVEIRAEINLAQRAAGDERDSRELFPKTERKALAKAPRRRPRAPPPEASDSMCSTSRATSPRARSSGSAARSTPCSPSRGQTRRGLVRIESPGGTVTGYGLAAARVARLRAARSS